MNDDRDLRDAFARLREADMRSAPRFGVHESRRRRFVPRLAFATLMLVLILTGGYVARRAQQRRVPPANVSLSTWRAPTDFLLQTPGSELLDSTPRLDSRAPVIHTTGGRS